MPFTIPSNDVAGVPARQSVWYDTDIAILVAGTAGTGVLTGCAVTAQGTPDMTVAIAAGTVQPTATSAPVTVTAGNVNITAADSTDPRIDLVSASASGTKTVTDGTAAATPKPPALPSGHIALAMIDVPANDTTIGSGQITDKRVFVVAYVAPGMANPMTTSGDLIFMNPAGGPIDSQAGPFTYVWSGSGTTRQPIGARVTGLTPGHVIQITGNLWGSGAAATGRICAYTTGGSTPRVDGWFTLAGSSNPESQSLTLQAGETEATLEVGETYGGTVTIHAANLVCSDLSVMLPDRLPIGTDNQVLRVATDIPAWEGEEAPTIRQAAGVPSGAPSGTELPIAFDTTASTGGLYVWSGAAWVKASTIP